MITPEQASPYHAGIFAKYRFHGFEPWGHGVSATLRMRVRECPARQHPMHYKSIAFRSNRIGKAKTCQDRVPSNCRSNHARCQLLRLPVAGPQDGIADRAGLFVSRGRPASRGDSAPHENPAQCARIRAKKEVPETSETSLESSGSGRGI